MTEIFAIAIALGMDAFSFSLALGLGGLRWPAAVRLALLIGVLHVGMPLLGLYLGQKLGVLFGDVAAGIGVVILVYLGARMVVKSCRHPKEPSMPDLRGAGTLVLAFSVSVDAFSVGFSLGTMTAPLAVTAGVIGVAAVIMTLLGVFFGHHIGTRFGSKAEAFGGVILVLIGLKTLLF